MFQKRKMKSLCMLTAGIILLSACGQETGGETEMKSEDIILSDFENYYAVAISENGYYYWEQMQVGSISQLMFLDRVSGKTVPLCNKPDCRHDNKNCNAYFGNIDVGVDGVDKEYLQYYDGSLYAVGCDQDDYVTLYRISADGSEWEDCTRLYKTDYSATGAWRTPSILIDDSRVYFIDNKQESMQLKSVGLDGKDEQIIFEDEDGNNATVYRMKRSGKYLYYQVMIYFDDTYENYTGGLYQYDIATGQSNIIKGGLVGPYSVKDNKVYYGNEEGLCCYSIANQSTKILAEQSMQIPYITLTKEYIAVVDQMVDNAVTLYDYSGKKIASVHDETMVQYFGGDSELLFAECKNDEGSLVWSILKLDQIGENLHWEKL